ncbi:hypothetical protein V8J82_11245 [Gymnodinialimonas sp. 2305UL16-5]|uniref:hypothetical protein n=1 Tax=Gymnodinialimonas mytili TaxID=3126503 RepID=UPI0030AC0182
MIDELAETGAAQGFEGHESVWYLRLFSEMHARYGFTADEFNTNDPDKTLEILRKYSQTDSVDPKDFPNRVWLDPARAGAHSKVLPHAHVASDFLTVSGEFLNVLDQFDLGRFASWPMTLLKKDKETPFEGEWFALWIGNQKRGFLREKSTSFEVPPYEDTKWLSIPNSGALDGDFVMDASVKDGPDIWTDSTLSRSLMLSDRLHAALNDAGLLRRLKVLRCPVQA